jgi:hypothetical protein
MSANIQIYGPAASPSTPSGGKKAGYPGDSLLYPVGISAGTHRIGGWVGGSRAGMDAMEKRKL